MGPGLLQGHSILRESLGEVLKWIANLKLLGDNIWVMGKLGISQTSDATMPTAICAPFQPQGLEHIR